jgi:hypothetical protein
MRKLLIFALSAAMALGFAANASSAAPIDYIAVMNGKCSHLIFAGHDGSSACVPKVVNDVHKDGRVGFTLTVRNLAVITFTGMGQEQVKDAADVATQPLDAVIFALIGMGTKPNRLKAAGVCTYSNPYAGPARISCSAHTDQGIFEARFISDGRQPSMQHF